MLPLLIRVDGKRALVALRRNLAMSGNVALRRNLAMLYAGRAVPRYNKMLENVLSIPSQKAGSGFSQNSCSTNGTGAKM